RQPDQINPRRASSGSQFYVVQGQLIPPHYLAQMQDRVRQATGDPAFTYPPEAAARYAAAGGTPFLDGQYTVVGELVEGCDVLEALAADGTARQHGAQGPHLVGPAERLWMVIHPLEDYTPPEEEPPADQ